MSDPAIEAAARRLYDLDAQDDSPVWRQLSPQISGAYMDDARDAIQAYLAAKEAQGFVFVNLRQIAVTEGPPLVITARPQIGGE